MGGKSRDRWRLICKLHLYLCLAACFFSHCGADARKAAHDVLFRASTHNSGDNKPENGVGPPNPPKPKNMNGLMEILVDMVRPLDESSSNKQPYGSGVSSPFSLPPYDSLAPIPLPENTPPFCVNPPPFTPQQPPPSPTTLPMQPPPSSYSPSVPFPNPPSPPVGTAVPTPPESSIYPTPPSTPETPSIVAPSPPETYVPSPSVFVPSPPPPPAPELSPPYYSLPSPPSGYVPNPPGGAGGGFVPSPRVYQPPNVYPSPLVPPPPPLTEPASALWCVAKPSVPGPIIQEAMNYACASGAECEQIQPSGSCFEPNTLVAHASYAFNSYWQRTKVAGGSCEFGGTAMLVTVDPSNQTLLLSLNANVLC